MMNARAKAALFASAVIALASIPVFSGTIVFKDGSVLTDVEIIGIGDGTIVIEKDRTKKNFPLKNVKTYSKSDLSISGSSSPDDTLDYKVTIFKIDMPDSGKDRDGKSEKCEISYSVSKGQGKSRKIKIPYFYLYVLTSEKGDEEGRKVFRFSYPDNASPKGSDYDMAAVMEKVSSFDRQEIGEDDAEFGKNFETGGRTVTFDIGKIGERKILAYRLECWGKADMVAEKTQKMINNVNPSTVPDKWWHKL